MFMSRCTLCVLCLLRALSRRVGVYEITIIIITIELDVFERTSSLVVEVARKSSRTTCKIIS